MTEARKWIEEVLLKHQAVVVRGVQGGKIPGEPRGGHGNKAAPLTVASAAARAVCAVTRSQVLQVALMATGAAAASVEQLHAVLLGWLQVRDWKHFADLAIFNLATFLWTGGCKRCGHGGGTSICRRRLSRE